MRAQKKNLNRGASVNCLQILKSYRLNHELLTCSLPILVYEHAVVKEESREKQLTAQSALAINTRVYKLQNMLDNYLVTIHLSIIT